MLKRLCSWLLYRLMGWTADATEAHPDKYIICLAPHTSNWDFLLGHLYNQAEGLGCNYMMKREWFKGPLGFIFRHTGGIPVSRDHHTSMTDSLAAAAREAATFRLAITPEGTRQANPDWKLGCLVIAKKAGIPVLLYGLDYERKLIYCHRTVIAGDDLEAQMREIKAYYKDFRGRKPAQFTIGEC